MTDLAAIGLDRVYERQLSTTAGCSGGRGYTGTSRISSMSPDAIQIATLPSSIATPAVCRHCARGSPYERLNVLLFRQLHSEVKHLRFICLILTVLVVWNLTTNK